MTPIPKGDGMVIWRKSMNSRQSDISLCFIDSLYFHFDAIKISRSNGMSMIPLTGP
jgi:hypothetical protein